MNCFKAIGSGNIGVEGVDIHREEELVAIGRKSAGVQDANISEESLT